MPNYDLEMAESVIAVRELEIERLSCENGDVRQQLDTALNKRDEFATKLVSQSCENEIIKAEFKQTLACRHARIDDLCEEIERLLCEVTNLRAVLQVSAPEALQILDNAALVSEGHDQ